MEPQCLVTLEWYTLASKVLYTYIRSTELSEMNGELFLFVLVIVMNNLLTLFIVSLLTFYRYVAVI